MKPAPAIFPAPAPRKVAQIERVKDLDTGEQGTVIKRIGSYLKVRWDNRAKATLIDPDQVRRINGRLLHYTRHRNGQPFFCADCDSELHGKGAQQKDGRWICPRCQRTTREKTQQKKQRDLFVEQSPLFENGEKHARGRRRNVEMGFHDATGFHPIRASKDYNEFLAGDHDREKQQARYQTRKRDREQTELEEYRKQLERADKKYGPKKAVSLATFVRQSGGIAPMAMFAGELARLGRRHSGTTGLINKKARAGGYEKMTADHMMARANEEGYRDTNGQPFSNVGDFLMAVEMDATGRRRQHMTYDTPSRAKYRNPKRTGAAVQCSQCGRAIKGKYIYEQQSTLAQELGIPANSYHPRCYQAKTKRNPRTIDLGNNETLSIGIFKQPNGGYLALTPAYSKIFKTREGAEKWLARRGFTPSGARKKNTTISKPKKNTTISKPRPKQKPKPGWPSAALIRKERLQARADILRALHENPEFIDPAQIEKNRSWNEILNIGRAARPNPARKVRKVNQSTARSANHKPASPSVSRLVKEWAGEQRGKVFEARTPAHTPRDLAFGGHLLEIRLENPTASGRDLIKFARGQALIGFAQRGATRRRLYIGLKNPFRMPNGAGRGALDFGPVRHVVYTIAKPHLLNGDRRSYEWIHKMGEEGGRQPHLILRNGLLEFAGGDYQITREGIRD